jgi:hypothetical protein
VAGVLAEQSRTWPTDGRSGRDVGPGR